MEYTGSGCKGRWRCKEKGREAGHRALTKQQIETDWFADRLTGTFTGPTALSNIERVGYFRKWRERIVQVDHLTSSLRSCNNSVNNAFTSSHKHTPDPHREKPSGPQGNTLSIFHLVFQALGPRKHPQSYSQIVRNLFLLSPVAFGLHSKLGL